MATYDTANERLERKVGSKHRQISAYEYIDQFKQKELLVIKLKEAGQHGELVM